MKQKVRIHGLSQYLADKPVNTLYKLVESDLIPFERIGRELYFDLDRIDEWMKRAGNAVRLKSTVP